MSGEKFRLVLSGNLVDGFDRNDVEEGLSRLMHLPLEHVQRLLQGKASKIPKELEIEKAERLCKKFNACGAESRIEPIIRKIADKQEAETTIAHPPSVDEAETDNLNSIEEDILQPTPDDVEMVDSLNMDLDLPDTDMLMPQDAQSIVVEPAPCDWIDHANAKGEEGDDEDPGQVFEQPNRVQEQDGNSTSSTLLLNKKLQLALGGLTLMMLLGLSYIFIFDSGGNTDIVQKQSDAQIIRNRSPADQESALTWKRVEGLSRQVRVWMLQYGSGDPMMVTLERLKQDLAISAEEMIDGWGMPLQYELVGRSYVIRSAGSDKTFMTEDDLVIKAEIY